MRLESIELCVLTFSRGFCGDEMRNRRQQPDALNTEATIKLRG